MESLENMLVLKGPRAERKTCSQLCEHGKREIKCLGVLERTGDGFVALLEDFRVEG